MRWNNPAVWLTAAAVAAVGVMAMSARGRIAYAENGCSRIVIKSEAALAEEMAEIARDPALVRELEAALLSGAGPDEIADLITDRIVGRLVPGCPSPLPSETVLIFADRPDEPMTLGEIRERMREEYAAAAAAGTRRTPPPAAMAGAFRRN